MDIYSATEEAYKNGYEAGKRDAVEVIRGRWIDKKYWKNKILYHSKECSNCHYSFTPRIDYNYCPNCGAKMYGGTSDV